MELAIKLATKFLQFCSRQKISSPIPDPPSAADDEITITNSNKDGDDKLRFYNKIHNKVSLTTKYGASSSAKDLRSNNLTHNA